MLFERRLRDGIHDGSITVAYRCWVRPQVRVGGRYRTGLDTIEVTAVEQVDAAVLSDGDVVAAAYPSAEALRRDLRGQPDTSVFRLEFRVVEPALNPPSLAERADFTEPEWAKLTARLTALDTSAGEAWTITTLRLIGEHPQRRAGDLAGFVGMEKPDFKDRVRKLKALGLTVSHPVGYELSPRGMVVLERLTD